MKTILVLTDFSDHALFALKVAASIAKKVKGKINLLHVHNISTLAYSYYNLNMYDDIRTSAAEQINLLVHLDFLKGIPVEKHVFVDKLLWEAIKSEEFKDSDLIVMGAHGVSGFNKFFIGSNTEKVVRFSDVPVLTIKNEINDFSIRNMVFASNFREESYPVFKKIKFFADLYHAHIDLLKVITPKSFEPTPRSKKLIYDFANKFKLKDYTVNIYNAYDIENGIMDFSEGKNTDLIAMETHGRTGFVHLLTGSLTEDLVKHEAIPLLSVKMKSHSKSASQMYDYEETFESWGSE